MWVTAIENEVFALRMSLSPFKTFFKRASILFIFWGSSIGEPELQSFRWIIAAILPLCVHTFDSMMSQLSSDKTAKTSDRRPTLSVPVSSRAVIPSIDFDFVLLTVPRDC